MPFETLKGKFQLLDSLHSPPVSRYGTGSMAVEPFCDCPALGFHSLSGLWNQRFLLRQRPMKPTPRAIINIRSASPPCYYLTGQVKLSTIHAMSHGVYFQKHHELRFQILHPLTTPPRVRLCCSDSELLQQKERGYRYGLHRWNR